MPSLVIFETDHWIVTHRQDSRYPGYLMVSCREEKLDLHELTSDGLQELGLVLGDAEVLLRSIYEPFKVIIAKLGFSSGFACHFHVAPVTKALLTEISSHQHFADEPDGNDAMLFPSRIYCERELSLHEQKQMMYTVSLLQKTANSTIHRTSSKLRLPASGDLQP